MDCHDCIQRRREIDAWERTMQEERAELSNARALNKKLANENAELEKRLENVEAEHSSTKSLVESLRKQLMAKSAELNSANNMLALRTEAGRETGQQNESLAKAHASLRERFRERLQQVSDLKTQLAKESGEKEEAKRQLKALEDRLKEAETTSAGLRRALDAKNAEVEEQERLVVILREQFRALGNTIDEEAAKPAPIEVLSAISSDFNGLVDSLQHAFAESAGANDSGVGSDIVAPSPVIEPAVTVLSLDDDVVDGIAEESSIANDTDVSPPGGPSTFLATSEAHPVLSRLLQQPPKPLKTAVKRLNFMQRVCQKPAKQARVEPKDQ